MFDWQRPIGPPDMFARRIPAQRQKLVDTMREQVGGQSTDSRASRAGRGGGPGKTGTASLWVVTTAGSSS